MLFNTPEFIFLFLPAAVVLHFLAARRGLTAALAVTTASSLAFYAWWDVRFVPVLVGSLLVNGLIAARLPRMQRSRARGLLAAGIAGNVLLLAGFKYDLLAWVATGQAPHAGVTPLALSFTTFVQIAFLLDVHRRGIVAGPLRYALFVCFFPHLIAGPIVRWANLGHQLGEAKRFRLSWDNVALGLTVFTCGLAKKVLLADALAPHIAGVFDAAAAGAPVTAFAAWAAAFAFSAQVYFDFSGYSDMAVGIALLFNFRLPLNFAAPLRATSMLDLWRRWHITLTQFFRDFVYAPLTLGRPNGAWRALCVLFTFALAGLWHGAGWTFVAWGLVHGTALILNAAWQRLYLPERPRWYGQAVGWVLTFTAFGIGSVFFRANDLGAAWHLLQAMTGLGEAAPAARLTLTWDEWVVRHGYVSERFVLDWLGNTWSVAGTLWTLGALLVIVAVPDTMEIVNYREGEAMSRWRRAPGAWTWRPSPVWLGLVAGLFAAAFSRLGLVQEFLYYQF